MFLLWQEAQLAIKRFLPSSTVGAAERLNEATMSAKTQQIRFSNIFRVVVDVSFDAKRRVFPDERSNLGGQGNFSANVKTAVFSPNEVLKRAVYLDEL